MKKLLLTLFSLIAITNGINAMELPSAFIRPAIPSQAFVEKLPAHIVSPADKIAALKTEYSFFREKQKMLELILMELLLNMHTRPKESLPAINWLLAHEQVSPDILAKTLVIAIDHNFYNVTTLLLEHGAPITDEARKAADTNLITHTDDRYVKLLEAREAR
jgi:hypothetical protein